jgi:uncharacterized membrane protein YkoI
LVLVLPFFSSVAFFSSAARAEFFDKIDQPTRFAAPAAISLEQAADKVRRETGGRVLSATPSEQGGRRGYSVRVLLDGKRVKKVFVDAQGSPSRR